MGFNIVLNGVKSGGIDVFFNIGHRLGYKILIISVADKRPVYHPFRTRNANDKLDTGRESLLTSSIRIGHDQFAVTGRRAHVPPKLGRGIL